MSAITLTRKFSSTTLINILFLILTAFIFAGCDAGAKETTPAAEGATPAIHAVPVDATITRPARLNEELQITGSLMANQQVDIVSELPRKIIRVNVHEGAEVKKGQLLFQMDNADLLAQLNRLQEQEKLALLNEGRMADLIKHEAVVQQDYDQSFTNLKVLQAQITEIKVAISKTMIRAPFDGQIGIVRVYPGAVVSVNTILANLQDNSAIKVDFSIPEKYAQVITDGSEQKFTVESANTIYKAKVIARESRLDQNTRTLLVRAVSPNPGRLLLAGQSARLQLVLHSSDSSLMVSSQALIPSSQGYNVYVIRKGQVQLTPVEMGQRGPNSVEILHGLNNGDTVVTSNLLRLIPGSAVQVVNLK